MQSVRPLSRRMAGESNNDPAHRSQIFCTDTGASRNPGKIYSSKSGLFFGRKGLGFAVLLPDSVPEAQLCLVALTDEPFS